MPGNARLAVLVSLVPLAILWRGWRPLDEAHLQRWADRFGPTLDDETRPLVKAVLERGRRLRAAGAAVGCVVWALPAYMNLIDEDRAGDFAGAPTDLAWLYGAALGTALAEVLLVQRPRGPRVADLEPRRWQAYVGLRPVAAVVAAAVFAAGVGGEAALRTRDRSGVVVAVALAAVAGAGLLVVGLRRIVHRPRLSVDVRLRVADEALRADGANRLAGAAVAMAGLSALRAVGEAHWQTMGALVLVGVVLQPVLFGWWLYLSRDVVRRMDRMVPA